MDPLSIIPIPVELTPLSGNFTLTATTQINCQKICLGPAEYLRNFISLPTGFNLMLKPNEEIPTVNMEGIFLRLEPMESTLPAEGYKLTISQTQIIISGKDLAGLFYGIQSLRQLLPVQIEAPYASFKGPWTIPCLKIRDYPRFGWRGFMIDECRHFFGKTFVKRMIDLMALHKLNKLHWHLTEDEGWRIESKIFPKLHEIASKRPLSHRWKENPNLEDPKWYGGYYTHKDIQEIIDYAAKHFIEVFPEIEMPGHATAPLVAYPHISCATPPEVVPTIGERNRHAYCAGNPETYKWLEQMLTEIIDLFPSDKIHIGGDELPTERWKECPKCQGFMKSKGIADLDQLQVYFAAQIIKFLNSKGKTVFGWFDFPVDRLLDQGIDPNLLRFQFWVGSEQKMINFVRKGGKAIISNHRYMYLDYSYWGINLKKAYNFDPIPAELEPQYQQNILGLEPPIWCERVWNWQRMDFQVFPRLSAYAETGWSPAAKKNYTDFVNRLKKFQKRLDQICVNYASLKEATNSFMMRFVPRQYRLYS